MSTAQSKVQNQAYYLKHEILCVEEDLTHEFKAHRNITAEDIPSKCTLGDNKHLSRQPIDKTLAAFLNTSLGGTVYIGVADDGKVEGLVLNHYQKDHIRLSVTTALSKFRPPVEPHRYEVRFIPVVSPRDDVERTMTRIVSIKKKPVHKHHMLQTTGYCWCDLEARSEFDYGIINTTYVTEIEVQPWDSKDPRNEHAVGLVRAPSVHETADGSVYLRWQASIRKIPMEMVIMMAKERCAAAYKNILRSLERKLAAAEKQAAARNGTHQESEKVPQFEGSENSEDGSQSGLDPLSGNVAAPDTDSTDANDNGGGELMHLEPEQKNHIPLTPKEYVMNEMIVG